MSFFAVHNTMAEPRISEFKVLETNACAGWAARVMDLRGQWTARSTSLPFFTLGMAAYLDAVPGAASPGGKIPYHATALRRHYNRLLQAQFGPLLGLVRADVETACVSLIQALLKESSDVAVLVGQVARQLHRHGSVLLLNLTAPHSFGTVDVV